MSSPFRRVVIAATFGFAAMASPALAASGQDAALIEKGKAVYDAQKCSTCHAIAGKGGKTNPLDGVGKKLSADEIRAWIVTPQEMDEEDRVRPRSRRCRTNTASSPRRRSTRWSPTCKA